MNVQHTAMDARMPSAGIRHGDVGICSSADIHLGIAKLIWMKPILVAFMVAAALDANAEPVQPTRPSPNKPPVVLGPIDDRELYGNPLHCVYHELRSASVHLLRCRSSKSCELPTTQALADLEEDSAKIVKLAPLPNGCMAVTLVGKLKLPDAPPWAGAAYPGWRPFADAP